MGDPEAWVDRSGTGFWPEKNRLHELNDHGVHSEIDAVGWIHFRLKCYIPRIVFRTAASKYKCITGGNSVINRPNYRFFSLKNRAQIGSTSGPHFAPAPPKYISPSLRS